MTAVYPDDGHPEIALPKGDVTEGVVRVGGTVRRPPQPQSPAVAAYLGHLASVGFDASPRFLGRDQAGRDVLTYLDGLVAADPPERWAAADEDIWPTWCGIDQPARLRIFADAYGLSSADRAGLVALGVARAAGGWLRMRAAAEQLGGGWARMWADGVGDAIRRQSWLTASSEQLTDALLAGQGGDLSRFCKVAHQPGDRHRLATALALGSRTWYVDLVGFHSM